MGGSPPAAPGRLVVESDLTFSISGAQDVEGRVEASGSEIRVTTSDAAATWEAALGSQSTGGAALSFAADRLAESGLVLVVDGPDGEVARVGAGIDSRLGRLASGSARVRLGSPRAVAPLARSQGRARATESVAALGLPPAVLAVGAAALLVVLVRRALRR